MHESCVAYFERRQQINLAPFFTNHGDVDVLMLKEVFIAPFVLHHLFFLNQVIELDVFRILMSLFVFSLERYFMSE